MPRAVRLARPLLLLCACLALSAAAYADTITLRSAVRISPRGGSVRLGDIARLEGPEAQRFADLVVAELTEAPEGCEIGIQQVRRTLDEAGAHWGKVNLNGRTVLVRRMQGIATGPPRPMAKASLVDGPDARRATRAAERVAVSAEEKVGHPTVQGAITDFLVAGLHIDPTRLRLEFEADDADLLAASLDRHRFEIHPTSSLDSDRVELTIRIWSEGRIVDRHLVTVRPKLHVETVRMMRDVRRGDVINETDLQVHRQWLPPTQAALHCTLAETVGRLADHSLREGDVLRRSDVRRPVLVERGDRVIVRCLVGGIAISMQAEAREDGAQGDRITLRKVGEREIFNAIVTGPHEAVVDLADSSAAG